MPASTFTFLSLKSDPCTVRIHRSRKLPSRSLQHKDLFHTLGFYIKVIHLLIKSGSKCSFGKTAERTRDLCDWFTSWMRVTLGELYFWITFLFGYLHGLDFMDSDSDKERNGLEFNWFLKNLRKERREIERVSKGERKVCLF